MGDFNQPGHPIHITAVQDDGGTGGELGQNLDTSRFSPVTTGSFTMAVE